MVQFQLNLINFYKSSKVLYLTSFKTLLTKPFYIWENGTKTFLVKTFLFLGRIVKPYCMWDKMDYIHSCK